MGKLINKFSWSTSAASDFEECRRKRYWAKYGMWDGWSNRASETQRLAYRLTKMDNGYTIMGCAVERAVMWMLKEHQANREVKVSEVYEQIAKPFLNAAWKESKEKKWEVDPKRNCCLREHYYVEQYSHDVKTWTQSIVTQTKTCIENFAATVMPRLQDVQTFDEIRVATPEEGDPESFEFEGIKIYAIPDYVYWKDGHLQIHDWKAGKPNEKHQHQLALYGLWATCCHDAKPDEIEVNIEYLAYNKVERKILGVSDLEQIKNRVRCSVADMKEYLEGGSVIDNRPLPMEDWEMTMDKGSCSRCNFYELCAPSFEN